LIYFKLKIGGFSNVRWVCNEIGDGINPVTAVFEVTTEEALYLSPFDFGLPTVNHRGLIGIQNFFLTVNTIGDLSRVWSHDPVNGQPISSVSVVIQSADQALSRPRLSNIYITPRILSNIPDINVYSYMYLDNFVSEFANTITPPAFPLSWYDAPAKMLQSNSRQLTAVPKYIYIVAKESNSTKTFSSTDTYAFIRSISLDFDNNTNLMASMTPQQLYSMSIKNGCNLSWTQWSKHVGSVICINVAQDMNLRSDLLPGVRDANLNFRVRADVSFENTYILFLGYAFNNGTFKLW